MAGSAGVAAVGLVLRAALMTTGALAVLADPVAREVPVLQEAAVSVVEWAAALVLPVVVAVTLAASAAAVPSVEAVVSAEWAAAAVWAVAVAVDAE